MSKLSNINGEGDIEFKNGEHFANELHKVADMLRMEEKEFLESYSYISEKYYYLTIRFILNSIKEHYRSKYPNKKLNEVIDTDTFDLWADEIYTNWGKDFYDLIDKDHLNKLKNKESDNEN